MVPFNLVCTLPPLLCLESACRQELGAVGERERALGALKWGTDWLLKATATPNTIYAQVP